MLERHRLIGPVILPSSVELAALTRRDHRATHVAGATSTSHALRVTRRTKRPA